MLLLLLIDVVLRALWKIDVYLIRTLVNKSLYNTMRFGRKQQHLNVCFYSMNRFSAFFASNTY